ncbi:MAG: triphosphoribosyl-dephospho-CoA synthase [Candidatus Thorarchaeota archaeon]
MTMFPLSEDLQRLTNHIRMCGELACLLEVSATPKPGNVHRFRDFAEIRYEDFLASSVAFGIFLEQLALQGFLLKDQQIDWSSLNLGQTIKAAIIQSNFFHQRSNTNLGIILLLSPLSVAAGMTISSDSLKCDISDLRKNVELVMHHTTVNDAIEVSKGIALANPGGLGKVKKYDVHANDLAKQLQDDNISFLKLMEQCSERDNICLELSRNYPITFNTGLAKLKDTLIISKDINLAIINAYLDILASYPDSLIQRKFGIAFAQEISIRARSILNLGGSLTIDGRRELEEFDIELQEDEKINPGTSADIVAATVFGYLLEGGKI